MNSSSPFAEVATRISTQSGTESAVAFDDRFVGLEAATAVADEPIVERRREPRFQVHTEGTLRSVRPCCPEKVRVVVMDVSRRGIKARVSRFVDVGWQVQLSMGSAIVFGQVRHCTRAGDDYIVGIVIQDLVPTRRRR